LKRRLTIRNLKPQGKETSLWFRANVGKTMRRASGSAYTNDKGLTVHLSDKFARLGVLRATDSIAEGIVRLSFKLKTTIEVRYEW